MLKIWPKVKVITWSEKVMLHISRSVSSAWRHKWSCHRSILSLSKVLPNNCWWPLMTWNGLVTLETWGGLTGENIMIQGVDSTCNLNFKSVSNVCLSIFSVHLYGKAAKVTWPWVTGIKIPRYTYLHFIGTVTDINRWKFHADRSFSVAMTIDKHSNCFWGKVTWPGDLTLSDLGLKISQHVRRRCMNACAKNLSGWGGAPRHGAG